MPAIDSHWGHLPPEPLPPAIPVIEPGRRVVDKMLDYIRLGTYSLVVASEPTMEERGARARGRWAIVRLVLGVAQMAGAVTALVLLATTGITRATAETIVVTCALTTASVLLFGSGRRQ